MARSTRNPHTASDPERVVNEVDTPISDNAFGFPRYSRAHMQAIYMQATERVLDDHRERTGLPLRAMVLGQDDETRRRAATNRLTNAIEAVSDKLTSAEYLELYNAAMGVHRS